MSDETRGKKALVLYHGSCVDGFTAAWSAWQRLGDDAEYRPVSYGDRDQVESEDFKGREVFILDFSYTPTALAIIADASLKTTMLDHHKTSWESLDEYQKVASTRVGKLDISLNLNEKCGARMAHEFFYQSGAEDTCGPVPKLIEYVEDRDLWKWECHKSREVNDYIRTYPFVFRTWDDLDHEVRYEIANVVNAGTAIHRANQQHVIQACTRAVLAPVDTLGGTLDIPCVTSPILYSEICHQLLEDYPRAPFAMCLRDLDGIRQVELRSRQTEDVDVSIIAKGMGGGGHKHAAGFTLSLPTFGFGVTEDPVAKVGHTS